MQIQLFVANTVYIFKIFPIDSKLEIDQYFSILP